MIRRMPNLVSATLSVNSLDTLADFSFCPNLEELYVRKNKISDVREICHLVSLKKLRNLWLEGNPCTSREDYRRTVVRLLPNLQKLDNAPVTTSELQEASKMILPFKISLKDSEYIVDQKNIDVVHLSSKSSRAIIPTSAKSSDVILLNADENIYSLSSSSSPVTMFGGQPQVKISQSVSTSSQNNDSFDRSSFPKSHSIERKKDSGKAKKTSSVVNFPATTPTTVCQQFQSLDSNIRKRTSTIQNSNVLNAVLLLLDELKERQSLEILSDAVSNRLSNL